MPNITIPNTFVNNTEYIDANQINDNFTAVTAVVNGALDNTNIASGANIAISKINLASGGAAFNKSTTGTATWSTGLTADTNPRLAMVTDGGLQFGDGTAAFDLALIRSAAKTLKLTDASGGTPTALDLNGGGLAGLGLTAHGVLLAQGTAAVTATGAGVAGTWLTSNGASADPTFQSPFQSTDQTITAAGTLTIAHGLARVPRMVWYALVCQVGEANYTAGQVIFPMGITTGTANQGCTIIADNTNLTVRFGSGATTFTANDATTGATAALTNASWKIRFFCF